MVSEQNSHKPDPDEPWRYVCRSCRGQVVGASGIRQYQCVRCGSLWILDELHDKKQDD